MEREPIKEVWGKSPPAGSRGRAPGQGRNRDVVILVLNLITGYFGDRPNPKHGNTDHGYRTKDE